MKKIAVLLVLTLVVGVAIYWREPSGAVQTRTQSVSTPSLANTSSSVQTPAPASSVRPSPAAAIRRLPPSFAGTQIDGRLRVDSSGGLIIESDIRRTFDYFLASIGEEPIEASVTRLRHYIEAQLPPPGRGQALRLLSQYLDYKRQLLALEQNQMQRPDLDAMRERLRAVQQLRAGIFDVEVHHAFFALEEAADSFTLERLAIRRDPTLDAAAKGAAIDSLQATLPADLRDGLVAQQQLELREQTRALQASGGSPTDLRRLRQELVGNAATERLERLDLTRQQWHKRLAAYRQEKSRIESNRGLGDADKRAAIARLAVDHFEEKERSRLEAAERLLAAKNG